MQLGIFAKTFPGQDPATVLGAAARAGYDGVAYNMACSGLAAMPDQISDSDLTAIRQAAAATGQRLQSLSGTYNMIHPNPAVRTTGHRRLAVLAAACRSLDTRLITLCTGTRDAADQWRHHPDNGTPEAWADLLASFEVAIRIAEDHDILLGVEPELANVVGGAQAARALIDQMQSDRIKIVLDPANLFEVADAATRHRLIDEAADLLGPHIIMAHAKDRDPKGGFATAGKGVVDFPHFLTALRRVGFDGPLVTHGLNADEAPAVAAYLRTLIA